MENDETDRSAPPLDRDGQVLRNAALEAAMREVALHDSPQSRGLLYQLLLDALVIVAIPDEPAIAGPRTLNAGESLTLVTTSDDDATVLPVFTHAEAVLAWRPEQGGMLTLPARAVLELAAANATNKIAINPGSATWGFVSRREIQALAQGRVPLPDGSEVVTAAAEVRVGRPQSMPPAEVMTALSQALNAEPTANAAWIFVMQQGTTPGEMTVGVDFAAAPEDPRHRAAMRKIVDGTGAHCEAARGLMFVTADQDWKAILEDGSGVEIFRRRQASPPEPTTSDKSRQRWPWTQRS
ncbi:hypothetical protein ABIA32_006043 [Streptacidiphilus sp. MAP12-20]|uniref:SseB family protein n=1 Tax=Streptacidiphilus sp. MAP12-20 TaxID=3156299 RepID=UPI003519658A